MNISKETIDTLNNLLDNFGIEKTWFGLLAKYVESKNRRDLDYITKDKNFTDVPCLNKSCLDGLSVGEISVLYEYSLAHINRDKRKNEGQYFTPDDVAILMADKSFLFKDGIWIDPCSGIGNLSFWLVKKQKNPEKFLKENLFLVDLDKLALFIARVLLVSEFQNKDRNLFKDVNARFIEADFLRSKHIPNFDYAILNPPYVMVDRDYDFETAEAGDLYAYFLEAVIKRSKGFISITPQSFTNGRKFKKLRELLISYQNNIRIYCFDNVPDNIFKGIKFGSNNSNKVNSTRAAITVASKSKNKSHKITPLLRWRSTERETVLAKIDSFLTDATFSSDIFPKLDKNLVKLYDSIKNSGPDKLLASLLSSQLTPYSLYVPTTPRYFISAVKKPINRTSFKRLFFYSKNDMDKAYMILNSSYMYWWWRLNDGGMTISEKTLLSLPIPSHLRVDGDAVKELEVSESSNMVVKRNAGKDVENVKHPTQLIKKINELIFPSFAETLLTVHSNSHLSK